MRKAKIAVVVIIALLLLIVIFQNTEAVETKILFVTIAMPRALLLVVMMLIGLVVGVLIGGQFRGRAQK